MNTAFVSVFAERLNGFIEQKRALGYVYANIYDPRMFDRMCFDRFPGETKLTADICNTWATQRSSESAKTTEGWSAFIREFARYLLRNGEQAYVLPNGMVKKGQRHIPHIYSHRELYDICRAFDKPF